MAVIPAPNTYYTLTVVHGSGGGFYLTNSTVSISANAAPAGEVFDNWTGAAVADPFSATTSLIMPSSNVTVTAVYGSAPPTFLLTVVNGTGSGSYAAGANVPITANAPPAGEVFLNWIGAVMADSNSPATTLIMPAGPVTVTANYGAPPPTYTLVVVNGSGSGSFTANTTVSIAANPAPPGEVFGSWSGASVADATAADTTLVMPASDVTVTAAYGFAPPAFTSVPQPVTGHPRLWITPGDLPRLRSWAVSTNAIYQQGLLPLLAQCVSDYNTQFFPHGAANPVYPDFGDSQGYTGLLSEQYMMIFALNALIDPSTTARIQYAQCAHDLMMHAMNQSVQGPLANAPFRDPSFPIYNRASFTSEAWPLTLDWLYDATNAAGQPIFTAQDKATIRNVFMIWAGACLTASTTGGDSPQVVGAMNNPVLLPGGNAYRMAANNYYQAHARLLTLMSPCHRSRRRSLAQHQFAAGPARQLAPQLHPRRHRGLALPAVRHVRRPGRCGKPLTGCPPPRRWAWPAAGSRRRACSTVIRSDPSSGELLALKTAGFADPAISGPQVALANNAPVWSRFVTGFISSLVPAQQIPPDESYLGPVYEFASYGDILRMYATPDLVSVFGVLSLLDRQNNDLSRLNAERWFAINAVQGGRAQLC